MTYMKMPREQCGESVAELTTLGTFDSKSESPLTGKQSAYSDALDCLISQRRSSSKAAHVSMFMLLL